MLDIKFIRENKEVVKKAAKDKGIDLDLEKLLDLDEKRRKLITETDVLRAKRKEASAKRDIDIGKELKVKLGKLEDELKKIESEFGELLLFVPNIPSENTPIGGAEAYKIITTWGQPPKFDFEVRDHITLGKSLGLIDLERGAKVAGYRGYFLKNEAVLMQAGLLRLAVKKMISKGFTPMTTPVLVREFALEGSGHFPGDRQEIYEVEEFGGKDKEKKYLTGTAEPALLAYHADEVLNEKDLPVKLCGISSCYRREVGGYGKDTKGLYRVHEFIKVEQVVLGKNDLTDSEKLFEEMNQTAQEFLRELELPHRVVQVSSRDMGSGKFKMYDIETWMPSRNGYGETHSNSNLNDWQARRFNIRYRAKSGKLEFVHTLNNTVIASPRILVAIIENYQQANGSVKVPKVLQEFVGKDVINGNRAA
ncbi:MAG: serine--tRNA ligase [bacterium]|nr:serine--tRNA ligase [bacterium]